MASERKDAPVAAPDAPRRRRPYAAPVIEQVTIVPEEAMFGFCKSTNGAPGATSQCGNGACSGLGS